MGRFSIDRGGYSVTVPGDQNIKKGNLVIFLLFHGKLDTRVLAGVMQLILPMWPNDKGVIHLAAS